MVSAKRNQFIDSLRGIAVVGMIIYHFIFLANFLNLITFEVGSSIGMVILGSVVRIVFFVVAGISSVIIFQSNPSFKVYLKKQTHRFLKIFEIAVFISLSSYVLYEDYTVFFGVLHALAFGVLIAGIWVEYKITSFFLAIIFLFGGFLINCSDGFFPLMYVLGFSCTKLQTFDYFSLFPWMGFIFLGQVIGNKVMESTQTLKLRWKIFELVGWIGKRALSVYVLHIPIVVGLVYLLKLVFAK